jgi:hypothetical protein
MVRHKGSISSVLSFQAWLLSMDFGPVRTDDGGSWRGDKHSTSRFARQDEPGIQLHVCTTTAQLYPVKNGRLAY